MMRKQPLMIPLLLMMFLWPMSSGLRCYFCSEEGRGPDESRRDCAGQWQFHCAAAKKYPPQEKLLCRTIRHRHSLNR